MFYFCIVYFMCIDEGGIIKGKIIVDLNMKFVMFKIIMLNLYINKKKRFVWKKILGWNNIVKLKY